MGFCLFEDADVNGQFLAVNSSFIEGIMRIEGLADRPTCQLQLTQNISENGEVKAFRVIGTPDDVDAVINKATQIGLNKAQLNIWNKFSIKPTPLLINKPGRIIAVCELLPEDFMSEHKDITTASIVYYEDGTSSYILERPGYFVTLTNQDGQVPILKVEG